MNTAETQRFGIEIETVGLTRDQLAEVILGVVGGRLVKTYTGATITMADGRSWNVVRDGSLPEGRSGEIVSPILTYSDIEMLQQIVRAVRQAGARADEHCGIHIHVDGAAFDVRSVLNLVNMVHKQERIIERALNVADHRRRYCKAIDAEFVRRLEEARPRTMQDLQLAWYGHGGMPSRYDQSRYHAINLNSLFYRRTIEFRYFNGTLHAGEVKAYVQFVLALASKALKAKSTSRARRVVEQHNEKWAFRVFLKSLGLIGPEFKTLRTHLLKRLEGKSNRRPSV